MTEFLGSCAGDCHYTRDWVSDKLVMWNSYEGMFSNKDNQHCMEIGSFEGRSTNYWAEKYCNGKGSTVDCLDTWNSVHKSQKEFLLDRFKHNVKTHIDTGRVKFYQDYSINTLVKIQNQILAGEKDKYNFIYIDGAHTADNVLQDAVLADQMLKVGGIMAFDDYIGYNNNDLPPSIAIKAFLDSNKDKYEVLYSKNQLFIKKVKDTPTVKWNIHKSNK